jgi:hypothetical protein
VPCLLVICLTGSASAPAPAPPHHHCCCCPRATGLSPEQLAACFTTDASSTPLRVVPWGTLGDTWPYFRPNFTALEELRVTAGAQRVSAGVMQCGTSGVYEVIPSVWIGALWLV